MWQHSILASRVKTDRSSGDIHVNGPLCAKKMKQLAGWYILFFPNQMPWGMVWTKTSNTSQMCPNFTSVLLMGKVQSVLKAITRQQIIPIIETPLALFSNKHNNHA